jgi:subtilisin family serine protease
VEPTYIFNPPGVPISAEFGCGGQSWTEAVRHYTTLRPDAQYDDVVPMVYDAMHIPDAWRRSPGGAGVTIGLVDTGIDAYQPDLLSYFADGASGGRAIWAEATKSFSGDPSWQDGCAHGTHMAGTIAAPMDGRGIVGVAWRANLITIRHHDDTANLYSFGNDTWESAQAIDRAAGVYGARIITMAWGVVDANSGVITNSIQYWYYNADRLFVGAAGTTPSWFPSWMKDVVFPASLPEVIAVTGVSSSAPAFYVGQENHYGSKVELAAVVGMPTEANIYLGESGFGRTDNSSNATAIVSGIAALTWAYYPWMNRDQLRAQLQAAGTTDGAGPVATDIEGKQIGYGVINAHKALGGMYAAALSGPTLIAPQSGHDPVTKRYYLGYVGGTGPYEYYWFNGGATTPYIDKTFYPDVNAYYVEVFGYVRDLSDGTTIFKSMRVRVEPPIDDRSTCPTCMQ